jgi:hypothetical protein
VDSPYLFIFDLKRHRVKDGSQIAPVGSGREKIIADEQKR